MPAVLELDGEVTEVIKLNSNIKESRNPSHLPDTNNLVLESIGDE